MNVNALKYRILLMRFLVFTTGFIFLLLISGVKITYAHKVSVFAYSENGIIYTESYFPDGTPVINGEIKVYDSKGKLLVSGKTDKDGLYNFKVPKIDDLKIVCLASMGHRAEFILKRDDIVVSENAGSKGYTEEEKSGEVINNGNTDVNDKMGPKGVYSNLTENEIRKIVEEEVSKQLKPIARGIAKLQENRPGPTEIIGGIGYILGLVGIAMYFASKRKG